MTSETDGLKWEDLQPLLEFASKAGIRNAVISLDWTRDNRQNAPQPSAALSLALSVLNDIAKQAGIQLKVRTFEYDAGLDDRVREVLHYLNRHYAEDIRVEALASMVSLSVSRLSHLFKEQVGKTMIEVLFQIRLDKAAELLRFTSKQVMEIAYDMGFNSLPYFTRKFTANYGMSPKKYREHWARNMQEAGG